ncbi:unnamed protein product [Calicophoron daubneyi]|uniref:Uncharacterized protein n=1 Tax=Calicophoron daubneyi TaxID=300641 RepID=A0AAV2T7V6_CALDB
MLSNILISFVPCFVNHSSGTPGIHVCSLIGGLFSVLLVVPWAVHFQASMLSYLFPDRSVLYGGLPKRPNSALGFHWQYGQPRIHSLNVILSGLSSPLYTHLIRPAGIFIGSSTHAVGTPAPYFYHSFSELLWN